MSKTFRLVSLARRVVERARGFEADVLDLSHLASEYGRIIHPCKACVSTAMPLCHWPCSCYPNHAMGQVNDWMAEIYERWVAAHGILIVTPVYWYGAPGGLKVMIDRLVCADGGNPDPTSTAGKDPAKAKALELAGWSYPKHLAGRGFALVVHGDVEGVDGVRRGSDRLAARGCTSSRPAGAGPRAATSATTSPTRPATRPSTATGPFSRKCATRPGPSSTSCDRSAAGGSSRRTRACATPGRSRAVGHSANRHIRRIDRIRAGATMVPTGGSPWRALRYGSLVVGLIIGVAAGGGASADELSAPAASPRVRVTAPTVSGKRLVGTLLRMDEETLTLGAQKGKGVIEVPRSAITRMEVSRRASRKGKGARIGALVGLGAAVAIGFAAGDDCGSLPEPAPGWSVLRNGWIATSAWARSRWRRSCPS